MDCLSRVEKVQLLACSKPAFSMASKTQSRPNKIWVKHCDAATGACCSKRGRVFGVSDNNSHRFHTRDERETVHLSFVVVVIKVPLDGRKGRLARNLARNAFKHVVERRQRVVTTVVLRTVVFRRCGLLFVVVVLLSSTLETQLLLLQRQSGRSTGGGFL
jgi:hypothetical protein